MMKNEGKVDYHIHSEWSPDSAMPILEALRYSQQHGIQHIAFTEHLDLGRLNGKPIIDFNRYMNLLSEDRSRFADLQVLIGVEAGVNHDNLEITEKLISQFPFEYVIYSLHSSQSFPFCSHKAYQKVGHDEFLHLYFQEMLEMVSVGKYYHVLGHFDYILRYIPYTLQEFLSFENQIKAILSKLIEHQAALEINTKGIQHLERIHPPLEILTWYKQLGGSLIVIGSDAHKTSQIGEHFYLALSWLQLAGFDQFHLRIKDQWVPIPL